MMTNDILPQGYVSPFVLAGMSEDTPIAVALSGGADSVVLLHSLLQMGARVCAIHVHHGIRGEEADRDEAFCQDFCRKANIPLTVLHIDVPALARATGESVETVARAERYRVLQEEMEKSHIPLLATAHHADDQLETILQHLLRGSGLHGLCGIPACRKQGDLTIVRPLLSVTKEEILRVAQSQNLCFVTDSTNGELCCQRNRLRLQVIPLLKELQPAAAVTAARCATLLSQDDAYLDAIADRFLEAQTKTPSVAALATLERPIFARVMRKLLDTPNATHISALFALVEKRKPHSKMHLPDGTTVRLENGRLVVDHQKEEPTQNYEMILQNGENPFPYGVAVIGEQTQQREKELAERYAHMATFDLCSESIKGTLYMRNRRAQDRILQGGHHKIVRRLSALLPYSPELRHRMPILLDDDGILAVPFCRPRDGANKNTADFTVRFYFD